nr:MAG TPA: hypothetical protein [Caudoviricetes sp.]
MFRRNRKFYLPKFVHRPGTTVNTAAHGCAGKSICAGRRVCKNSCYLHSVR